MILRDRVHSVVKLLRELGWMRAERQHAGFDCGGLNKTDLLEADADLNAELLGRKGDQLAQWTEM